MNILIMDGQGGRLGSLLVEAIRQRFPQVYLSAVGTNAMATAAMLKAGAQRGATGENAVRWAAQSVSGVHHKAPVRFNSIREGRRSPVPTIQKLRTPPRQAPCSIPLTAVSPPG